MCVLCNTVQFVGKKTWIFYPPSVYRGANFMSAFQTDGHVFPRRAPSEPYDVYVYTSRPGDVLFFDDNWVHIEVSCIRNTYIHTYSPTHTQTIPLYSSQYYFQLSIHKYS